jgi:hypothetical protein
MPPDAVDGQTHVDVIKPLVPFQGSLHHVSVLVRDVIPGGDAFWTVDVNGEEEPGTRGAGDAVKVSRCKNWSALHLENWPPTIPRAPSSARPDDGDVVPTPVD